MTKNGTDQLSIHNCLKNLRKVEKQNEIGKNQCSSKSDGDKCRAGSLADTTFALADASLRNSLM